MGILINTVDIYQCDHSHETNTVPLCALSIDNYQYQNVCFARCYYSTVSINYRS